MTPALIPDDEDIDGFDDFPVTHLDDDEYDEFLAAEFDAQGRPRGEPRVGLIIGLAILLLLVILVLNSV